MQALFLNGMLHGFSWDGTPALAPVLGFTSWEPVLLFLLSYGEGADHNATPSSRQEKKLRSRQVMVVVVVVIPCL
jgi:hypothetical protein